jgi:hypothetical protein
LELLATVMLIAYFFFAISSYIYQGFLGKTGNQLRTITAVTKWFMWSLIVAEIGGFLIIFCGVLMAICD